MNNLGEIYFSEDEIAYMNGITKRNQAAEAVGNIKRAAEYINHLLPMGEASVETQKHVNYLRVGDELFYMLMQNDMESTNFAINEQAIKYVIENGGHIALFVFFKEGEKRDVVYLLSHNFIEKSFVEGTFMGKSKNSKGYSITTTLLEQSSVEKKFFNKEDSHELFSILISGGVEE